MSEHHTATLQIIGRLAIQRSSDLKRIDAIKEDVRKINSVDGLLWNYIMARIPMDEKRLDEQVLRDALAPVHQYFNTKAVVGLAEEWQSLEKRVAEASEQLKSILGIEI